MKRHFRRAAINYNRTDWPHLSLSEALKQVTWNRKATSTIRHRRYSFCTENRREWGLWWGKDLRPARQKLAPEKSRNLAQERVLERKYPDFPF